MKILKFKSFEKIILDIEKGDILYGGRFKNKKTVVKKIGKNAKGDITINDKPLLKYRILKESVIFSGSVDEKFTELTEDYLLHLIDNEKLTINIRNGSRVQIFEQKNVNGGYNYANLNNLNWSDIKDEIIRYIHIMEEDNFETMFAYTMALETIDLAPSLKRSVYTKEDILNKDFGSIKSFYIEFKNNN
jgi:hypothetical protein